MVPDSCCLGSFLTGCAGLGGADSETLLRLSRRQGILAAVPCFSAEELLLLDAHRPGGSSPSMGLLQRGTRKYLGKGDFFTPSPTTDVLREVCSNDIYAYFGCHTQRLAVADLPWILPSNLWEKNLSTGTWHMVQPPAGYCDCPLRTHYAASCNGEHDVSPKDYAVASSALHVIAEWIDGFHSFSAELLRQLMATSPPVNLTVQLPGRGPLVPVVGIGEILAVALLVNDIDCLGNSCGNVGFTVVRNDDNVPSYAKAIKIDPGFAFTGCDPSQDLDCTASGSEDVTLREFILSQRIPLGSGQVTFYARLPADVKREFNNAMASVLVATDEDFERLFMRDGLQQLFPSPQDVQLRVRFLAQRRDTLRQAYGAVTRTRMVSLASTLLTHTDVTVLVIPDTVPEFLSFLRARYSRGAVLRDPITLRYHAIEDRFVNLALLGGAPGSPDVSTGSSVGATPLPADVPRSPSTREGLVSSFNALRAQRASVEMKDVLRLCGGGGSRRVNLKGGAGIGKSTCCQCIVSSWAKGAIFTEFTLVLWIPLRHLTSERYPSGNTYDEVDVIIRECLELHPSPELRAVVATAYDPSVSVWVLDGYDEIVDRVPEQVVDVLGRMLAAQNRILTGRPNAMEGVPCDVAVEVAGFTDDNIREYVGKFIQSSPQLRGRESSMAHDRTSSVSSTHSLSSQASTPLTGVNAHPLYNFLRRNRLAWELAHIPINLVLLCHVLSEDNVSLQPDRLTLTELYSQLERLMLRRYCVRRGEDALKLTADRITLLTSPLVDCLAVLAFRALQSGAVMIAGVAVAQCIAVTGLGSSNGDGDGDGDGWSALLDCGMLVRATSADAGSAPPNAHTYHFLHLTLQEYFAGVYVARMLLGWKESAARAEVLAWLQANKDAQHLEVMWWFVAGLLAQQQRVSSVTSKPSAAKLVEPACVVCGAAFHALTRWRHHCRLCGHSVCDAHSRRNVRLSPDHGTVRLCLPCIPASIRADGAMRTLLSWWSDSLLARITGAMSETKVRLWIQIAEECSHVLDESDEFSVLLADIAEIVLRSVLGVLKGQRARADVPWFATLQQCPKMAHHMLCDNEAFVEAVTAAVSSASVPVQLVGVDVLRGLGEHVVDYPWMTTLLVAGAQDADHTVRLAVMHTLLDLGEALLGCAALHGVVQAAARDPLQRVRLVAVQIVRVLSDAVLYHEWLVLVLLAALNDANPAVQHVAATVVVSQPGLCARGDIADWFHATVSDNAEDAFWSSTHVLCSLQKYHIEHPWLSDVMVCGCGMF